MSSQLAGFFGLTARVGSTPTQEIGDRSTADTIQVMRALAIQQAQLPIVQTRFQEIVHPLTVSQHVQPTALDCIRAMFNWIKTNVRFVEDEQTQFQAWGIPYDTAVDRELLISPEILLTIPDPQGDCDDYTTLLACFLCWLGVTGYFVTIAADANYPNRFSHVFLKAILPETMTAIDIDASHGPYLGWSAKRYTRKQEWRIC